MNFGLLKVWKENLPIWVASQVHDAVAFAYDEQDENWIIDYVRKILETNMTLKAPDGTERSFSIPTEALVGWNLAYRTVENPDGLVKWKGSDERVRQTKIIERFSDVLDLSPASLNS